MSQLSLNSNGSQTSEDWDRSLMLDDSIPPTPAEESQPHSLATTTPRNSIVFPGNGVGVDSTPKNAGGGRTKRSLSELLRLHAEKGTDCHFSTEEAARLADVLGQWINASSSPYEDEDDDFFNRSHDDLSLPSRRSPMPEGRSRGQSESGGGSRPPSSAGTRS